MLISNKQIKTFFIITIGAALLFSTKVHGEVSVIAKDQPAIHSGYLFEKQDWLKARIAVKEAEQLKVMFAESKELIHIQENRLTNKDNMIKELNGQLDNNEWLKSFYFVTGVFVGGLTVHVLK